MNAAQMIQAVKDYFSIHPNLYGLIVAAIGALLFIGALRKWKWVLAPNNKYRLFRSIIGQRAYMLISSAVITIGGLVLFLVL